MKPPPLRTMSMPNRAHAMSWLPYFFSLQVTAEAAETLLVRASLPYWMDAFCPRAFVSQTACQFAVPLSVPEALFQLRFTAAESGRPERCAAGAAGLSPGTVPPPPL